MQVIATLTADVRAVVEHVPPCTPGCLTCYPEKENHDG